MQSAVSASGGRRFCAGSTERKQKDVYAKKRRQEPDRLRADGDRQRDGRCRSGAGHRPVFTLDQYGIGGRVDRQRTRRHAVSTHPELGRESEEVGALCGRGASGAGSGAGGGGAAAAPRSGRADQADLQGRVRDAVGLAGDADA